MERAKPSNTDQTRPVIEGAELSFLKGATRILRESRPAILVEVQDFRTKAWGYGAHDILEFLERLNYRWFGVREGGKLEAILTNGGRYDSNLVALPRERTEEIAKFVAA